jgi:hypothetical protein
MITGAEARQ